MLQTLSTVWNIQPDKNINSDVCKLCFSKDILKSSKLKIKGLMQWNHYAKRDLYHSHRGLVRVLLLIRAHL